MIILKKTGFEVIKLEFILRHQIKRNDWLHADTCPQAANHCAYFESENELKIYNLEAWSFRRGKGARQISTYG